MDKSITNTIQETFAQRTVTILSADPQVTGITVGGSWLSNEIDEFSDLDLIIVTKEKITHDQERMKGYAKQIGNFLSGFIGDHVGEPRLLICLYDDPLLHVDLKFLTIEEFRNRVEEPVILFDREGQLQAAIQHTPAKFPHPDHQWIEDRFWIWIHYILLKIGRGELLEAYESLGFLRNVVFGPLLHIKNGKLPRAVRKVEIAFPAADLKGLLSTLSVYDKQQLFNALRNAVELYRTLRKDLYTDTIILQSATETKVMEYFDQLQKQA